MRFLDLAEDDPKRANSRPLLFFVLVTSAVGAFASVFTEPNIAGWYAGLVQPSFAPPNWVFAPVWTTLYVLMAVAAWRVWRLRPASPAREALAGEVLVAGSRASEGRRGQVKTEMAAYVLQLIFNFAWSAIFFAAHQIGLALIEICVLLVLILTTTVLFWRRDRLAGLLFLPYLAWTSFATVLNYTLWSLNP